MSGATTRNPAAASGVICCRQPNQNSGKPCNKNDQRPIAGLDVVQPRVVADLGVALTKFAGQESWRLLFRHPTRAAGVFLAHAHCDLPWGCFPSDGNALAISWHHPAKAVLASMRLTAVDRTPPV